MKRKSSSLRIGAAFLALILSFLLTLGVTIAQVKVLDGKTFTGFRGRKGKEAQGVEELRFENGKLVSVSAGVWGFRPGVYTTKVEGDGIKFEAQLLSPRHGKVVWEGRVKGDYVNATYHWIKECWYWKDTRQEYWFKGRTKNYGKKGNLGNILDGRKFAGPTGEKGKEIDHEDVLIFQGGMFLSTSCEEFGFAKKPYIATVEGEVIHFQSETESPKYGKMVWRGVVKDEMLEATYIWLKEKWYWKIRKEYWFKGTLQK